MKSAECEAQKPSRECGSSLPRRSPTVEHIAEESYSKLVVASIAKSTASLEKPAGWREAIATGRLEPLGARQASSEEWKQRWR